MKFKLCVFLIPVVSRSRTLELVTSSFPAAKCVCSVSNPQCKYFKLRRKLLKASQGFLVFFYSARCGKTYRHTGYKPFTKIFLAVFSITDSLLDHSRFKEA